ncbi:Uncharacterised protein [Mycobacteroides abscessus subsp. abscessus]|nr:Uncharacterised protein [Mycobacteroides abscessus subsp. abscessus]
MIARCDGERSEETGEEVDEEPGQRHVDDRADADVAAGEDEHGNEEDRVAQQLICPERPSDPLTDADVERRVRVDTDPSGLEDRGAEADEDDSGERVERPQRQGSGSSLLRRGRHRHSWRSMTTLMSPG